jgi:hypothetical protein
MAFPTTGVLDDFNDTENPMTGWSLMISVIAVRWRSDGTGVAVADGGANANDYWNASTFGADSEAYLTISTVPPDGQSVAVYVRVQNAGSAAIDGYAVSANKVGGGTDTITIVRIDDNAPTTLATNNQEFANGDSIGIEIIGSTITAYYKSGAGAWTALANTASSSTYSGAGHIGMTTTSSATTVDNFGGGTITGGGGGATSTPPPKSRLVRGQRNTSSRRIS